MTGSVIALAITQLVAMVGVGSGLALLVVGMLARAYDREERLAEILDLPYGDRDVDLAAVTEKSAIAENLTGLAGRVVARIDTHGALRTRLEKARVPLRPGEFVVFVACIAIAVGMVLGAIAGNLVIGLVTLVVAPLLAKAVLDGLVGRRRRQFEAQFPDALSLIASSMSAGHTFLRSIQMMTEEALPPLSEEFARVVHETQLGDPLIDALGRMAGRLDTRDVDWVVQAIRIQQNVGGKLADLLHTLADFIRARDEVRREVQVLTAEGRLSAWVLGALPVALFFAIQAFNPGYLDPMFQGWGWVALGVAGGLVVSSITIIQKMVKSVEV
ncbi:MAG: type II secretion system F family protein [Acidimicrobiales bacterium]